MADSSLARCQKGWQRLADLNSDEIQCIKELAFDPRFAAILEKIKEQHGGVPTYRPGDKDPRQKHDDWVYRSGVDDGISLVLTSLGYER